MNAKVSDVKYLYELNLGCAQDVGFLAIGHVVMGEVEDARMRAATAARFALKALALGAALDHFSSLAA